MKALFFTVLVLATQAWGQQTPPPPAAPYSPEINTVLMESTFLIQGPSARPGEEDKRVSGTAFVMVRPAKQDVNRGPMVLVTAKHVLDDIKGDTATLTLRRQKDDGSIELFPWPITIRIKGKNMDRDLIRSKELNDLGRIGNSPPKGD